MGNTFPRKAMLTAYRVNVIRSFAFGVIWANRPSFMVNHRKDLVTTNDSKAKLGPRLRGLSGAERARINDGHASGKATTNDSVAE
jgi:hypothetical protein